MSDTPYEKECMFCKTMIRMSKESGKWLPYNLNNGPHDCRTEANAKALKDAKEEANKMYDDAIKKLQSAKAEVQSAITDIEELKHET